MSIASHDTKEDKIVWLLQPVELASTLSFFGAVFGVVYWYFGYADADLLVIELCAVLLANYALLAWGSARVTNVARGRQ